MNTLYRFWRWAGKQFEMYEQTKDISLVEGYQLPEEIEALQEEEEIPILPGVLDSSIFNKKKSEAFDIFKSLKPNQEFTQMEFEGMAERPDMPSALQNHTLGYNIGHSFYIPIGYMIDEVATYMLHRRYPSTRDMFMIIRRVEPYWYEIIGKMLLRFRVEVFLVFRTNSYRYVGIFISIYIFCSLGNLCAL